MNAEFESTRYADFSYLHVINAKWPADMKESVLLRASALWCHGSKLRQRFAPVCLGLHGGIVQRRENDYSRPNTVYPF